MFFGYGDPFESLFAFQRALENRLSSDWLGSSTASMGTYPPVNVFQQDDLSRRDYRTAGSEQRGPKHSGKGEHHSNRRAKGYRISCECKPPSTRTSFGG